MSRNLESRVEVVTPVDAPALQPRLKFVLDTQRNDRRSAWEMQADGTYWLEPYETGPGVDPKALKILKSVDPTMGTKTWYYVEYRQAVGFDSFLSSNGNVLNGVVVHTGTENSGNSSDLLDMTPATSSWNDPALEIGQSFYDPDAGVTIAPTWASVTDCSTLGARALAWKSMRTNRARFSIRLSAKGVGALR